MRKLILLFILVIFCKATEVVNVDLKQTGYNPNETILTASKLVVNKFGKLGKYSVDGLVFSQPLYVPQITINSKVYNVVIIASLNNTVYAFDADIPGNSALWSQNFGSVRTSYNGCCAGSTFFYGAGLGIVSTPVIDTVNNTLFVVNTNSGATWVLRKLNLLTGAIISSVTITGQVAGTGDSGDTVTSGNLQFNTSQELQRPSLILANSKVYIAFGGVGDNRPWHGWLFAYDTTTLTQQGIFCATPNTFGGAIWQSGGAPAVDDSGNIYVTTGNGNGSAAEFSESIVKLSPTLSVLDWFKPSNAVALDSVDADVSANRPILIPGTTLLVVSAKDFNVYVIDTTCMGHVEGSSGCSLQKFKSNSSGTATSFSGSYGGLYMNNMLYFPTTTGSIYGFSFNGTTFATTPTVQTILTFGFPGPAQMSGTNGILWAATGTGSSFTTIRSGALRAYDPITLTEIWNSTQVGSDNLGTLAKFSSPKVINGRVYVATQDNDVVIYGLKISSSDRGNTSDRGSIR